jgi:hypothetical protein
MTKAILAFLLFTYSILLAPIAEAACYQKTVSSPLVCEPGERLTRKVKNTTTYFPGNTQTTYTLTCCKDTPAVPYATGESRQERDARHRAECQQQGKSYNSATGRCTVTCPQGQILNQGQCKTVGVLPGSTTGSKGGFFQMKPTCASGFHYSESANNCVANKRSDDDDDDRPRSQRRRSSDDDDDRPRRRSEDCAVSVYGQCIAR